MFVARVGFEPLPAPTMPVISKCPPAPGMSFPQSSPLLFECEVVGPNTDERELVPTEESASPTWQQTLETPLGS